jgi:hypothetical protein
MSAPERTVAPVAGQAAGLTRSTFLARAALATAATFGAAAAGPVVTRALAQEAIGDIDLLNFLLVVQHVEAGMYDQAVGEVDLSSETRETISTFLDHERAHVAVLGRLVRRLGGDPEEAPGLDFGSRMSSERSFLLVANDVEEVASYSGTVAARQLASKDLLAEVAKLLQVDSRHSAAIATRRGQLPTPSAFEGTLSRDEARQRLRRFTL